MKSTLSRLFIAAVLAVLAGCSSTGGSKDTGAAAVEDRSIGADSGAVAGGASGATSFDMAALNDPNSPLSRRVIYFEYDSSNILAEDQDLLIAHAGYMAANPGQG